jgi:YjbE family integral membrane protein
MMEIFTPDYFWALAQVIGIDLVLAGDNAIVIGLAAAGLPAEQRNRAILLGIIAATVMRIGFALITTQLLAIVGLLLAGGILLLWVCWKMWRELQAGHGSESDAQEALAGADLNRDGTVAGGAPKKTFAQAALQIVIADITMSLDNVLAVAGAGHDQHVSVIIIGLGLSIALMGFAATFIARLLSKHRWIAYVGLAIILYVALSMIWEGWHEVSEAMSGEPPAAEAPAGG